MGGMGDAVGGGGSGGAGGGGGGDASAGIAVGEIFEDRRGSVRVGLRERCGSSAQIEGQPPAVKPPPG